jgi:phosphosulfolactate synthase (CoM biosynthesis protein A)
MLQAAYSRAYTARVKSGWMGLDKVIFEAACLPQQELLIERR